MSIFDSLADFLSPKQIGSGNVVSDGSVDGTDLITQDNTVSSDSGFSNPTPKVINGQDLKWTTISTPDHDTFVSYVSSVLPNDAIETFYQSQNVDPLVLAAIAIVQTKGNPPSKSNYNIGTMPTDDIQQYDSYASAANRMITNIGATKSESEYLSNLRFHYVNKPVTSQHSSVPYYPENVTYLDRTDATYDATLENQRLKWFNDVETALNDLYSHIMGGSPGYEDKSLVQSKSSVKEPKPNSTNQANADGVKVKSMRPHGDHSDSIIVKLPEGKTYCEPVYPDLLTVADAVPQYTNVASTVSTSLIDNVFALDGQSMSAVFQRAYSVKKPASQNKPDSVVSDVKESSFQDNQTTNPTISGDTVKNESTYTDSNTTFRADSAFSQLNAQLNSSLSAITGTRSDMLSRQIAYDPTKHKNSFKQPSRGKAANNDDAFPVDLKIEELEIHFPHEYIHELQCCPQGLSVGKALLAHASAAEKRTVKLENNMATIMRYLFALGSRMHINCVYYGGQSQYQKYKCIRCLKDNRVEDAQDVSIDQCLACTRYEPILGAVYEIINDKGANLAQILDDNQMAYGNMREYTDFVNQDSYSQSLSEHKVGAGQQNVTARNPADEQTDFDVLYKGKGIKMNWDLVPVEQQKPHIGWRQSINDDGSYMRNHKLGSYQYSAANMGAANSRSNSVWIVNKTAMDSNSSGELSSLISRGQAVTNEIDNYVNAHGAKDYTKNIVQQRNDAGVVIDTTASIILSVLYETEFSSIAPTLRSIESELAGAGIQNEIITATCFGIDSSGTSGTRYFVGEDALLKKINDPQHPSTLNWANVNSWKWVEFAPYLSNLGASSLDVVPKICYAYSSLQKFMGSSRYDTADWGFPFTEDQITSLGDSLTFSSGYGERPNGPNGSYHYGNDYACPEGTELHSCLSGTVVIAGDMSSAGNVVCVQGDNGTGFVFMHCLSILVSTGDHVDRGQVIATSSNTGGDYGYHLHLGLTSNASSSWDSYNTGADINPATMAFPKLLELNPEGKAGSMQGAGELPLNTASV